MSDGPPIIECPECGGPVEQAPPGYKAECRRCGAVIATNDPELAAAVDGVLSAEYLLQVRLQDDLPAGEILRLRCRHIEAQRGTTPTVLEAPDTSKCCP